ncbi:MAG: HoxN/HupN/NixA family nickel/cobalt transporter [Gammaproteobacteria bacterium]|nr:HoxN/HupN/NixA family nickel/cobalt transporter [Gammaproteobacteria bacterium]
MPLAGSSRRGRLIAVGAVVLSLNLLAGGGAICGTVWAGGFGAAGLGVGMIAYLLGVRHAFDADHIAAIDNVTRRLRGAGQRPMGIGLFFSLGHSTVVVLLTAAVVFVARHAGTLLQGLAAWGSVFGTLVSASFLTVIGVANLRLLAAGSRRRDAGEGHGHPFLNRAGVGGVDRSWKMFPLGMLFGLSFDTASEVALLAMSVAAAHDGNVPLWCVMLLPMLFTAGMTLMDTVEGLLVLRLYDWAIADRDRTLLLNTLITGLSVFLAFAVALYEWISLYGQGVGHRLTAAVADSPAVGLAATAVLLSLGALAWFRRRQHGGYSRADEMSRG